MEVESKKFEVFKIFSDFKFLTFNFDLLYYIDPLYIVIALPAFFLGICSQLFVRYMFRKYSQVINSKGITGVDVVEKLAEKYGIRLRFDMKHGKSDGSYNPINKTIALSEDVARTPSIAAVGIAAHEMGHAIQHKKASLLFSFRTAFAAILNITSTLGYFLLMMGFIFQIIGIIWIGILLFSGAAVFSIVTLPIEFDASRRAMKCIREQNLLDSIEADKAQKVLTAAALTYVAATVQSLSVLLYFILRAFGISSRRN